MIKHSQVRFMQAQDLMQVIAIEQAGQLVPWTENMLNNCLRSNNYQCWVAEHYEKVVGFAIALTQLDECHIVNIGVEIGLQRQGIGRALIEQILQEARHNHAKLAFLEVRSSNQPAIQLYRSLGFEQVGRRKNYYYKFAGEYEDALVFTLLLT